MSELASVIACMESPVFFDGAAKLGDAVNIPVSASAIAVGLLLRDSLDDHGTRSELVGGGIGTEQIIMI